MKERPFPLTQPVKDTVPKINNEVAVGEDLTFQYRWWRFERVIWLLFTILVLLDLAGVFGRDPAAKGHFRTHDGSMDIEYERIERFSTPSILTVKFGQNTIHDEQLHLWVSESLVEDLGAQRIVPQPLTSAIGQSGILYTFPATVTPASIALALSPASPGMSELELQVPGFQQAKLKVLGMP
jgi:hypothetical protein